MKIREFSKIFRMCILELSLHHTAFVRSELWGAGAVRSLTSLGGYQESKLCRLTAKNHGTVVLYEFLINVTHITAKAHTHRLII